MVNASALQCLSTRDGLARLVRNEPEQMHNDRAKVTPNTKRVHGRENIEATQQAISRYLF